MGIIQKTIREKTKTYQDPFFPNMWSAIKRGHWDKA